MSKPGTFVFPSGDAALTRLLDAKYAVRSMLSFGRAPLTPASDLPRRHRDAAALARGDGRCRAAAAGCGSIRRRNEMREYGCGWPGVERGVCCARAGQQIANLEGLLLEGIALTERYVWSACTDQNGACAISIDMR
jgi:hypothetical protein